MAVIENSKLTVVGAGSVGASVAYAALIRESARQVALFDIDSAKVEAEVLDLAHGTQFTGSSEIIGGSDVEVARGSNVVVITAGAKQKPGQTRIELAGVNAGIMRTLMPQLLSVAPNAVYIIVTNPCDVLTLLAQEESGLPASRIFASGTVLDTSRLRWEIGRRAGVSTSSVHALIVGEHGDTEFPMWSDASIGPVPIREWVRPDGTRFNDTELDQIADDTRNAAYKVIQGKGATNYAIGLSSARIVEAVLRDENVVLPVATVLNGFHGLDDVALSVPSIVGAKGATPIAETQFSASELARLHASADSLKAVAASLR